MESNSSSHKYNISFEDERTFWKKYVINKWIKYSNRCPACNLYSLKLKKVKSAVNPYKLQCNKKNCRKIVNIRKNTIFEFFSHTPISILINAAELFICDNNNGIKTIEILRERYHLSSLGQKNIYKFFNILRKCISQYYYDVYNLEKFADNNALKNIAVDESLFVHDYDGTQEWVIGLIDIQTKKIRLELAHERNENILKKIIQHHVGYNNTIISDGWEAYNWLRDYGYHHIVHVHGRNDFGMGNEATSHIESIWGQLKGLIVSIYNALTPENFIYYLKEMEFRYEVKDKNNKEKINQLISILEYCYSTCNLTFVSKDDLIDYDKEYYANSDSQDEDEFDEEDEDH